jgi:hypothetical protein
LDFIFDFLGFFRIFLIFAFFEIFEIFGILGGGFLSKFLRLLLKVTKVTTGHQKLPKMG